MYANCVDARMEVEHAKIGTAVPAVRDISDLENRRINQVIPFVNEEEEEERPRRKKGKSKDWQSRNFLDDDDLEFEFLDLK